MTGRRHVAHARTEHTHTHTHTNGTVAPCGFLAYMRRWMPRLVNPAWPSASGGGLYVKKLSLGAAPERRRRLALGFAGVEGRHSCRWRVVALRQGRFRAFCELA